MIRKKRKLKQQMRVNGIEELVGVGGGGGGGGGNH